jgi:ribosome-associated toxin RatA of RatAB toxin-antitoxin module
MTVIKREALVIHTPKEMFTLVNDVAAYPVFLPWCADSIIHHQTPQTLDATICVQKGPIQFKFRTRNNNTPPNYIHMTLIEGPFKNLTGKWHFEALGDSGCKITFELTFEFNSTAVQLSLSPVIKYIADTILNGFCERADQLNT